MSPGSKAVSIPLALAPEIDTLVGRRNRSAFIFAAVRRSLADPELQSLLRVKRRVEES